MELPGDPLAPKVELGPRMGTSTWLASLSVVPTEVTSLGSSLPRPDPHLNVVTVSCLALERPDSAVSLSASFLSCTYPEGELF